MALWQKTARCLSRLALVAGLYAIIPQELLAQGTKLEQPIDGATSADFVSYINAIFQFGLILVVLAAAIYFAFGAYAYFLAAGNASMAAKGKELIQRSLVGLLLALVSWVLLNTISPQFAGNLKAPSLPPGFGGGQSGGGGASGSW